jgi:hypothetical protein
MKERYYPGRIEADEILPWLNRPSKTPGQRRINELLSAIHAFHSVSFPSDSGLRGVESNGKFRMARMLLVKQKKDIKRASHAFKRIYRAMSGYVLTPLFTHATEFGWQVQWFPPARRHFSKQRETEVFVLLNILELAKQGQIERLRRCDECTKWHFAKFKHQRFCSTECQQKHYKKSPEWKAHRLAYMRRYRRIKNLPNVK